MSKILVRRERIRTIIAGQCCEVYGGWQALSNDFGVLPFATHAGALNYATAYAHLAYLHRKGPIQ